MKRIILLICLLLFAQTAWAAEPIKIGVVAPLTGDFANVGKEVKQTLGLLVEDVNKKGGVLSRKVNLIFEDDGGSSQTAVAAGERLIQQGVIAVIGSQASNITESLQDMFNKAKIIQISYGSTAIPLTEKGLKYFFRTCPRDNEQARAAKKVMQKMKIKTIALIHDNSLYGKGLAEAIKNQTQDKTMNIVFYEALIPGQQDYIKLLEKAKGSAPEMVFFAGYYPEAAKLLQGRNQLKWKILFMGGDAVNNVSLVHIAGKKAAEGFYFLSPPNPDDIDTARTKRFLTRFEKNYRSKLSTIDALLAGDAFSAIVQSIKKVNTTNPDLISDYLRSTYVNNHGLTGVIDFDSKGDIVGDLHGIYRVDANGRFVVQRLLQHGDIVK